MGRFSFDMKIPHYDNTTHAKKRAHFNFVLIIVLYFIRQNLDLCQGGLFFRQGRLVFRQDSLDFRQGSLYFRQGAKRGSKANSCPRPLTKVKARHRKAIFEKKKVLKCF